MAVDYINIINKMADGGKQKSRLVLPDFSKHELPHKVSK